MQFLKTLFWAMVTALLVIFASRNWNSVTVSLWGGLAADIKLPVLMLLAFLAGLLPCLLLYYTACWRHRRKADLLQRALDEARTHLEPPAEAVADSDMKPAAGHSPNLP